ncbi:hypothetical protein Bbelb_378680 [Branchiostoma belcheri]|nr:hypothetical protein Bbelb_378680 [Branchiostoma belcheri]
MEAFDNGFRTGPYRSYRGPDPPFVSGGELHVRHRQKRSFVQYGMMIHAVTGRNPLDYNDYGCYCGLGGAGTPVDNIDKAPSLERYRYRSPVRTRRWHVRSHVFEQVATVPPKGGIHCDWGRYRLQTTFDPLLTSQHFCIGQEEFERARDYISRIVECFSNGAVTEVGVIQYDDCTPKVGIPLGHYRWDTPGLLNAIRDFYFSGGQAETEAALRYLTRVSPTVPVPNHACPKPCLSQTVPVPNCACPKPCLSQTVPVPNRSCPKPCLSQTVPVPNRSCPKPCLSQTMPEWPERTQNGTQHDCPEPCPEVMSIIVIGGTRHGF